MIRVILYAVGYLNSNVPAVFGPCANNLGTGDEEENLRTKDQVSTQKLAQFILVVRVKVVDNW